MSDSKPAKINYEDQFQEGLTWDDGLNLVKDRWPAYHHIDDVRLKRGEDVLVVSYPRTG